MSKLPDIVRIDDVAKLLGVHMQTVHNMIRRGDLPPPKRIGKSRPFWFGSDIAAALNGAPVIDEPKAA